PARTREVGPGLAPELSKLAPHVGTQSGSAALTCGKPPAFPPMPHPSSSSAQAGRLSLPACAEEVDHDARPSERRSLSARQAAEPPVVADKIERNFDKRGACPGPTCPALAAPRGGPTVELGQDRALGRFRPSFKLLL